MLFDYLQNTKNRYTVFVANRDVLYFKLKENFSQHSIKFFVNVRKLYLQISLLCVLRRVKCVYVNESGHSRYIALLSKLFPHVKFLVHVRIIEDVAADRWPKSGLAKNVTVIAVSNYIRNHLPVDSIQLYDPYPFVKRPVAERFDKDRPMLVAIIGRVSVTKGIDTIISLLELIRARGLNLKFSFHFFGEVYRDVADSNRLLQLESFDNVKMHGFVGEKSKIFASIDCVIHASGVESLGRIFLEAVEFGKPFIGINNGGIGELAYVLNLKNLLIEPDSQNLSDQLLNKLMWLTENYTEMQNEIIERQSLAVQIFSPAKYVEEVDAMI